MKFTIETLEAAIRGYEITAAKIGERMEHCQNMLAVARAPRLPPAARAMMRFRKAAPERLEPKRRRNKTA